MKTLLGFASVFSLVVASACGPAERRGDGGDGGDSDNDDNGTLVDAAGQTDFCSFPQPESCADGLDNDCDLNADCSDVECSGVGDCPVCGSVDVPEANPLVLPDGQPDDDLDTTCSSDAGCAGIPGTSCVAKICRVPYISTLNFVGFPQGATLDDTSKFLSVCVNMEHTYLRDLQMELITPGGTIIILHDFAGRSGSEKWLGYPNTADNGVAGSGMDYCWKAAAPKTMLETVAPPDTTPKTLRAGDYRPVTPFTALQGSPLNGEWSLRVTDLWQQDDGFLFNWSIAFDPSLVEDCAGPIIGKQFHGREGAVLPISSSTAE